MELVHYKIYGVVVLYHPEPNVLENIETYINDIERLYVIDNSEIKDLGLIEKIKALSTKITYIDNNGNQGIAHALNIGAQLAIKDGATWLLTMDQDSKFEKDSLQVLIRWIINNNTEKVGIISPCHVIGNYTDYRREDMVIDELSVMTSGNLLNLEVYKKVGPFEQKYFIDYVDHEYCLRLRKNGFLVKVHKGSILIHKLGNISVKKILGKTVAYTNHNYLRRYYITRNRLYTIRRFFFTEIKFTISDLKYFLIDWIKIILFENDKKLKSKMIILGIYHFIIGKDGKLDE